MFSKLTGLNQNWTYDLCVNESLLNKLHLKLDLSASFSSTNQPQHSFAFVWDCTHPPLMFSVVSVDKTFSIMTLETLMLSVIYSVTNKPIVLSVIMLRIVRLHVVMLSVVAPPPPAVFLLHLNAKTLMNVSETVRK